MGKRHRSRVPASARPSADYSAALVELDREIGGAPAAEPTAATAAWNYRGGVSSSGGSSFDGAKFRGALRGYYPTGAELDTAALRSRSRSAYWDSTQARSIIQRLVDNVVGAGLTPRSSPAWNLIGSTMSEEERRKLSDKIDELFKLWADSHEPDAMGRRNFAELQGFAFSNELRDGDLPVILRYSGDSSRVSPLSLQFIDADQLDGLGAAQYREAIEARGNLLRDGLEVTKSGALVAIYVYDPDTRETTRVPVHGSYGRRFVVFPAILELVGQFRGVGPLAALVHEIQKLTDYSLAEIEAAVVNALIAGMIQPGENNDTRSDIQKALAGGGISERTAASATGATAATGQEVRIDKPGLWVGNLKAGETLASFDTKRPNVNFGTFVETVTKSLSSSVSIPIEVLEMKFSSNYSASRAALIQFWQVVERWRVHIVSQFLAPIYEAWLREEVALARFPVLTANGFGVDPVRTRAWLQADWVGDSMPSIDPVKDATADDLRIAQGATTRERVALKYNRSDYYDNAARLRREAELLPPEPATTAAARQVVPPSDEDEEGKPVNEDESEETDFEGLKQEMDSYGVAVRAGAITPQPDDEEHFRTKAGFPAMSDEVKGAWKKDGGIRRPITLALPGNPQLEDSPTAPSPAPTPDESEAQPEEGDE